jgi:hypothetical protein
VVFRASLEEFARKHKEEIRKDPVFRAQFHKMCANIGVDPLVSSKASAPPPRCLPSCPPARPRLSCSPPGRLARRTPPSRRLHRPQPLAPPTPPTSPGPAPAARRASGPSCWALETSTTSSGCAPAAPSLASCARLAKRAPCLHTAAG